jgi:hypothetical protein
MNGRIAGSVLVTIIGFGCADGGDNARPITDDLRIVGDLPDDPPIIVKPPVAPMSADLKMDGTMRFYGAGSSLGVQINVVNIGNAAATGSGMVNVAGFNASASVYQYWDGSPPPSNTLLPGKRGYLMAYLPLGAVAPCTKYLTHIDTSRTIQFATGGAPDPFVNDEANVATQCVQWTTKLNGDNFPISGPTITGNSIYCIISSFTVGRTDGNRCSNCHWSGSGLPYSPPVARGSSAAIWPTDVINGRTWAGPNGWAQVFIHLPTDMPALANSKPFFLQSLMQTWVDHGERATQTFVVDPCALGGVASF